MPVNRLVSWSTHAQAAAEVGLFNLVDVDAVVPDFAVGNIVEPVNQVGDGGLARAGGAHKGNLLAGLSVQADVVQHQLVGVVAKVHVVQHHFALQAGIGDCAVRLVGMLPSPHVGALFALHQVAVPVLLGVYQGDVALVGLGLFVNQVKDTLGAGHAHDNHIQLTLDRVLENCLVMFKNGTTMLMPKAMPERLRLGAPVIIITPETMATHTYSTLPMLFRMGISMLA